MYSCIKHVANSDGMFWRRALLTTPKQAALASLAACPLEGGAAGAFVTRGIQQKVSFAALV